MGYEVLIVDEFADLQGEKESIRLIEEIGAKARACGIHMILSTQRPDHKILNGRIKANVSVVLGLKTTTDVNSRVIIDEVGLEKLRGAGHGLFKYKGDVTEVQCPNLGEDEAIKLIQHTYVEKIKPAEPEVPDFDFLEVLQ